MRTCECFARCAMRAPSSKGWLSLLAIAMITGTPVLTLAQWSGADDAFLPSPVRTVSTVPANGDVNPYGVAFVPRDFQTGSGPLKHGDILVSNFNNSANLQGTGTTIVRVPASGSPTLFFQGNSGLGLSTAVGLFFGIYPERIQKLVVHALSPENAVYLICCISCAGERQLCNPPTFITSVSE